MNRPSPGAPEADVARSADGGPAAVVDVRDLRKEFHSGLGSRGHGLVAVQGASFTVPPGGSLGIVGESGSGKTTIARMLAGLERPTAGTISVAGHDRSMPSQHARVRRRRGRELQIVFQDPYTSLDPRQTAAECIDEVLCLHFKPDNSARRERVSELLDQVGLDERQGRALPRRLSGGQRQRVAIARALAAEPQVLLLDEAVSALDVSIQAQVLNLLNDIREATHTAYIFISHNLAVIRQITEQTMVLRRGEIVEYGQTEQIMLSPQHAYTRLLLDSVPRPGWSPTRAATT